MIPFPPVDVDRVLAVPGVARCMLVDQASSALDLLERMAADGEEHGAVVVADEQLAGRGRHGKTWHSPLGGLWMGFLARPLTPPEPGAFAIRVALGLVDAMASLLGGGRRLGIKWPNDILLEDKKAGGILCEAKWQGDRLQWIAVGIGLNLVNPIDADLEAMATTLGIASRTDLLEAFLPGLVATRDAPPVLTNAEVTTLAATDWLTGRTLEAPVRGVAAGIDPSGRLRVRGETGLIAVREGTVVLAPV